MENIITEGENPVLTAVLRAWCGFIESCSLRLERKTGGDFPQKLNICLGSIADKYREGKMKRTLKRELKVPEIVEKEANGTSFWM